MANHIICGGYLWWDFENCVGTNMTDISEQLETNFEFKY